MPRPSLISLLTLALYPLPSPAAPPPFTPLGTLDAPAAPGTSAAYAITPDGSAVFGTSTRGTTHDGFRWTRATGILPLNLGDLGQHGRVTAVSADGQTIVGDRRSPSNFATAFTATNGVVTPLPPLPGYTNPQTNAYGISADGTVITGMFMGTTPTGGGVLHAVLWTNGIPTPLVSTAHGQHYNAIAYNLSRDGSTAVGAFRTSTLSDTAFRWSQSTGMHPLPNAPGYTGSAATAISPDNATIIGASFRDTDNDGSLDQYTATRIVNGALEVLGDLPGGPLFAVPHAVSADGSVIVGRSAVAGASIPNDVEHAFIWDPLHGMRDLNHVLTDLGADLTGWTLTGAHAISDDGTTIAGVATNPAGQQEAFVAIVPEPTSAATALALLLTSTTSRRRRSRPPI